MEKSKKRESVWRQWRVNSRISYSQTSRHTTEHHLSDPIIGTIPSLNNETLPLPASSSPSLTINRLPHPLIQQIDLLEDCAAIGTVTWELD